MQTTSKDARHPVLIVDDEPDVLFSLKGLLRHDFELYTAESGEQALEILRQHPVHVIMTDQRMPGMTGVELMRHVRTEYPDAVRIVFTGYADIKAVVEAINSGGLYRYITKPWDPDELIQTLHRAAERYQNDVARAQFTKDAREFAVDVRTLARDGAIDDRSADLTALAERAEALAAAADGLF
ncbi:MAG: response regulator [Fuerstiella sp.]